MLVGLALLASAPIGSRAAADAPASGSVALDVREFQVVEGPNSGPAVYYSVRDGPAGPVLSGAYLPGMQTVTMGVQIPQELRHRVRFLRWLWRASAVPERGDECRADHGDSAASVSLAYKRGMRWYVLKYVWSAEAPLGAVCDRKRSLLLARDTVVLERGPARGTWLREVVDVRRAFIDHFAGGDPNTDVPELVGIGVMTDGDQTQSTSGAEWAAFELTY
jgi:hypothetical protein